MPPDRTVSLPTSPEALKRAALKASSMKEVSRSRQLSIAARAMRGFYRVASIVPILIAMIGTVLAILVNQPQTYNPDYLHSSRLSSLNLVTCNPEPLVPMRCIVLGNGEHFRFENADNETVLRWTRHRIEKEYSDEVGKNILAVISTRQPRGGNLAVDCRSSLCRPLRAWSGPSSTEVSAVRILEGAHIRLLLVVPLF